MRIFCKRNCAKLSLRFMVVVSVACVLFRYLDLVRNRHVGSWVKTFDNSFYTAGEVVAKHKVVAKDKVVSAEGVFAQDEVVAHNYSWRKACTEVRHFAFLKVPKAGSSTVQNIFFRFGLHRNVTFVLPKYANYISYFPIISKDLIIPPPAGKMYEAMCSHVMYNQKAFRKVLPADSVFIGILRNPETHMPSYLYFYHGELFNRSSSLEEYMIMPEFYNGGERPYKIPPNLLADYFGLKQSDQMSPSSSVITEFIAQTAADFDFIILLERLDESLLLMKRKFCWKIEDILYQPKMVTNSHGDQNVSDALRRKHRKIAAVDFELYDYFSQKLSDDIENEKTKTGDFEDELKYFRIVLNVTETFCDPRTPRAGNDKLRIVGSKWSDSFELTLEYCRLLGMDEMSLMNYVGEKQYGVKLWTSLHSNEVILH